MAGGRRRTNHTKPSDGFKKNKSNPGRRRSDPSSSIPGNLFVDGGFLSDRQFQPSPTSSAREGNSRSKGKSGSKSVNLDRKSTASSSGIKQLNGNAIGYEYPPAPHQEGLHSESQGLQNDAECSLDNSQPLILLNSKTSQIVAYVDDKQPLKADDLELTYGYGTSFVLGDSSHRGLGFHDEDELVRNPNTDDDSSITVEEQEGLCIGSLSSKKETGTDGDERVDSGEEVVMANHMLAEASSPNKYSDGVCSPKNSGFLSIGGLRLYTQDVSDEESDDDGKSSDGSSEYSEPLESDESSESDSSAEMSCSDSDIDDEVAEDYLEGIGGSEHILKSKWLVKQELAESDDDSFINSLDDTLEKLGGIALQEASKEYGIKKTPSRKKSSIVSRDDWSSLALDDLLVKDYRSASARKKKNAAHFACSWPPKAPKSKASRKYPGEKKKYRKETIAVKRRERMLNRGVDLRQINLKLEHMVLNKKDMFSFQPMHPRDCSQVRRVAAIYRLHSGCQGFGKKRFVTVTRTQYTGMPSSSDQVRLEQLIGARDEGNDFSVAEGSKASNIRSQGGNRSREKKNPKTSGLRILELNQSASSKSRSKGSAGKVSSQKKTGIMYADQPVSFVSSGVMQPEAVEITTSDFKDVDKSKDITLEMIETTTRNIKNMDISRDSIGAFEVHTKGFGSKMMAKMGFVEGGGLGKDGQGMASLIEVIKRPKSLGLGVEFSEASTSAGDNHASRASTIRTTGDLRKSKKMGAFEEHTKGFGSKMMAKMGFVEGGGLGKHGQAMARPIEVMKMPKSLGLGVEFSEISTSAGDHQASRASTVRTTGALGKAKKMGAFEEHTKGFGSKMMAKMGFVEGKGLGKDSQGMINPLLPVRRPPKARGLGAKG